MLFQLLIVFSISDMCGLDNKLTCTLSNTILTVTGDGTFDSIQKYENQIKSVIFQGTTGLYISNNVFTDKSKSFEITI